MKQSSIDWLAEQYEKALVEFVASMRSDELFDEANELVNKHRQAHDTARKMHRQEIEEAYEAGYFDDQVELTVNENYYTETFEQNG